ncbi:MAG: NAD(P)-dependent oxidoreductase [Gammaproteobacteria bacterium]
MIEIVADKDIPYLEEVFENSKSFRLKTLPFNEINKKTLKNSQALLSRSATIINDELIEGTDIKFIFSLTSGEDHIDFDFLSSKEVFIKTAKGANAQAVLEYTLDALSFSSEKKVGLIGAGHIGSKLKKVLSFFNYKTITFDPYKFEDSIYQKEAALRCPIISVNASYSKKGDYPSHNLISHLKPDQMLINTSRGEVVNYKGILKNSNAKLICDVWNKEPNLNVDDIGDTFIGTPHIAGNTLNSKTEALNLAIDSLKEFFETNDLNNLKPINKTLNLDKFLDNDEIKEGEIPFKFIKRFIDIESISDSFKKDLNLFNGRDSFSNFFQAVRKKNERMGFRDYLLSTKLLSDEKKELLTLLGFKIQDE